MRESRIHILASNYRGSSLDSSFDCAGYFQPENTEEYPVNALYYSTYHSNKSLNEEATYVRNRQGQASLVGNNLEKPQIFLNKTLVRETQVNEE